MIRRRGSRQVEEEAKTTGERVDHESKLKESDTDDAKSNEQPPQQQQQKKQNKKKSKGARWGCIDSCCWFVGCVCVIWWCLTVLYNAMPSALPQFVMQKITGPLPDPPGVKLRKEGLFAKHPVVFVPGIVTGGLELWEGKPCADGLFRKRLWGGTFGEIYKRSVVSLSTYYLCCNRKPQPKTHTSQNRKNTLPTKPLLCPNFLLTLAVES
jgi:phospholipid:diacylglycerol acyltransferase